MSISSLELISKSFPPLVKERGGKVTLMELVHMEGPIRHWEEESDTHIHPKLTPHHQKNKYMRTKNLFYPTLHTHFLFHFHLPFLWCFHLFRDLSTLGLLSQIYRVPECGTPSGPVIPRKCSHVPWPLSKIPIKCTTRFSTWSCIWLVWVGDLKPPSKCGHHINVALI